MSINAYKFWVWFDSAYRGLSARIEQITKESSGLNLTHLEWMIMNSLFDEDGKHATDLARTVNRIATSFTPILDRLVAKGYVERRSDKADRRAIRVHLTEKGLQQKAKFEECDEILETEIRTFFEEMSMGKIVNLLFKAILG